MDITSVFISTGLESSDCRRENASRRWVRPAARLAEVTPRSIRLSRSSSAPPGQAATQQLEAADDAGQHVVEVVGDAAGQLADRFHFLRLAQHFLVVAQLRGAFLDLLL